MGNGLDLVSVALGFVVGVMFIALIVKEAWAKYQNRRRKAVY